MRTPDYSRRVAVTGLGVISPVGNDVHTAWDNLIHGRSGLGEITRFDVSRYEAKAAGEVKDLMQVRTLAEHFAKLDEANKLGALFGPAKGTAADAS